MNINEFALEELGAVVCETLANHKIDAVLSGGSCVSVWTDNKYSSNDMDMITTTLTSQHQLSAALESIGFIRSGKGRYYVHPDTELALEFPSGPLMVGDEQITEDRIHNLQTKTGTLRLLSPTDCVKDRLAAFYHWGDKQSWEQAISVARRHKPDWAGLQRWHHTEGVESSYADFRAAVENEVD